MENGLETASDPAGSSPDVMTASRPAPDGPWKPPSSTAVVARVSVGVSLAQPGRGPTVYPERDKSPTARSDTLH